jgi:hypothetical protein
MYLVFKYSCSLSYETLGGATGGNIQCLPFYSLLLALGNPTVNYFRQKAVSLEQEKMTFSNIISLANKYLLASAGLGQPHSQLFQAKSCISRQNPGKKRDF